MRSRMVCVKPAMARDVLPSRGALVNPACGMRSPAKGDRIAYASRGGRAGEMPRSRAQLRRVALTAWCLPAIDGAMAGRRRRGGRGIGWAAALMVLALALGALVPT